MARIFSESFTTVGPWTYANPGSLDPDAPRIIRTSDSSFTPAEAIQSEANYPGGLGGLGNIHYINPGSNDNSQSLTCRWLFDAPQIWMRWYTKFGAGMNLNPGYSKDLDFQHGTSGRIIFGHQGGSYGWWNGSTNFGQSGFTWNDLMGGSVSDEQWHLFEVRVRIASGLLDTDIWIDNDHKGSSSGTAISGGGSNAGWEGFNFWTNQSSPTGSGSPWKVYIDDLEVDDAERVGPIGGGEEPAPAFRAPRGRRMLGLVPQGGR